jgi:hypothetical protein
MINKSLEQKLKKNGFDDIIRWLEKCESGKIKVLDIRVDKTVGITGKKPLDNAIILYLKELNIKVLYSEYSAPVKKSLQPAKVKCKHFSHKIFNKKLNHEENVSNFLNNKIAIFKVDKDSSESFAICPACTSMIKIS